ncbi:DNA replication licensing ATPase [Capsaspora owczarzaki ATCC 30864]|uniref:DNA replication licensing factor MCM7 n=1 Tax=Capsaspora owczarzaki (strain ATCC 30864) TaxID=595528 RepID=A0A0D2WIX1_CAPO3|nr:DNA replication licensing ATPase [Capsaspora owczarzaki ATCC 30864]KJE89885.1 DNA replication licensing ATPase [Capsaspora owczarzaki ATCC 30864]|eukprot:XP_004349814.1 DNA replication licensing ATPase [Capsaspora owczarzaki ATCC 30864]
MATVNPGNRFGPRAVRPKAPEYEREEEICRAFISDFTSNDQGVDKFKYMAQLQQIADRQQKLLIIDLEDVSTFDADFATRIESNTARYLKIFAETIDKLMPPRSAEAHASSLNVDPIEIFMEQRIALRENNMDAANGTVDPNKRWPPELLRRFEVHFGARDNAKQLAIRQVRANEIGHLVRVRAIVTRTTEVKPLLRVATYTCDKCDTEIYQENTGASYMPLITCISPSCIQNGTSGNLFMQTRGSKFVSFQEIKIQEIAEQVPVGHIPRTMTAHVRGDLTRMCSPGDIVILDGIFMPAPYTGFRAMRAGLLSDTYLDVQTITRTKKTYEEDAILTPEQMEEMEALRMEPSLYDKLASSIAPEIYGHDDVKKALLLLLVGGVNRNMSDGMRIRGDINVCLMGDPGVAKSQLLRFISTVSPRGVYTTGKGSSGVGLTAAVTKDPFTGELVLEGGALVLADKGVCCIDEFDKMEEGDRTAIHEVMEQQTISIAKAGITTTLNARTSILAAANPAYGRYNLAKSAAANINLPAALLSRFDLMFLLLDRADQDDDHRLAKHITYVHQHSKHPPLQMDPLSPHLLRQYVAQSRMRNPIIPRELSDYITGVYTGMRLADSVHGAHRSTLTTARTLLAILRLSTALARLRNVDEVSSDDVDEATRLMDSSKVSLEERHRTKNPDQQKIDLIFELVRDLPRLKPTVVGYEAARAAVLRRGFHDADFEQFLVEYEEIGVVALGSGGTEIRLMA